MNQKILKIESDWQLMVQGDKMAFYRFYKLHVQHLLNYGLRLYGSLFVVEDLIQELFLEIWERRETLAEPDSERFYLLRALRNKINRQFRIDQRFIAADDMLNEPRFSMEPSSEQRWIELDIAQEQKEKIEAAIRSLSPRQREIVYLRYFNDLSYYQICEITGLTYQSARSQLYQSLKVLRTVLDQSSFLMLFLLLKESNTM